MNELKEMTVTDFVLEKNINRNPGITTLIMEILEGHLNRKVYSHDVLTPKEVAELNPLVANLVIDDAVEDAVSRM